MDPGPVRALLDTHAAVFLWEGRVEVFGPGARAALEGADLLVSPVTRLELGLLREIGRIAPDPDTIIGGLEADCGVLLTRDTMSDVIRHAMHLAWTRDPFDRLLVATALAHDAQLITRNRLIHEHFEGAVWV